MDSSEMKARGPLDESEKRRLVLKLITQLRCVECGRPYDPHGFALIHRWKDMWVLSTRCQPCDKPCHVVVFMQLDTQPTPLTDLLPEEIEIASQWPPITADDVLDVHDLLREFDGDPADLFER